MKISGQIGRNIYCYSRGKEQVHLQLNYRLSKNQDQNGKLPKKNGCITAILYSSKIGDGHNGKKYYLILKKLVDCICGKLKKIQRKVKNEDFEPVYITKGMQKKGTCIKTFPNADSPKNATNYQSPSA